MSRHERRRQHPLLAVFAIGTALAAALLLLLAALHGGSLQGWGLSAVLPVGLAWAIPRWALARRQSQDAARRLQSVERATPLERASFERVDGSRLSADEFHRSAAMGRDPLRPPAVHPDRRTSLPARETAGLRRRARQAA